MNTTFSNTLKGQKTPLLNYLKKVKLSKSELKAWGKRGENMLAPDIAVQYLILLLKEKSKRIEDRYSMTQSVSTIATHHAKEKNSIESVSSLLAKKYNEISKLGVSGIYTVLNAGNGVETKAQSWIEDDVSGLNISHQNWLYLDVNGKKLIRFEPSDDYEEFRTGELCESIVEKLSKLSGLTFTYEIADRGTAINTFSGCKSMSTLLAIMHIEDIPLENTSLLRLKTGKGNENLTVPFAWLMQNEVEACVKNYKKTNISKPTRKNELPYIVL